jgi:hypothetical protein
MLLHPPSPSGVGGLAAALHGRLNIMCKHRMSEDTSLECVSVRELPILFGEALLIFFFGESLLMLVFAVLQATLMLCRLRTTIDGALRLYTVRKIDMYARRLAEWLCL